jgi:DNA-binding transcriptional regulator YhcF (GntR family)
MRAGPSDTFIAHKAINLSDDLSGTEKRVAAAIIDHFNRKTGQCDPGLDSIARLLGVSRRTIIRAISALVRKGYLHKTRHGGKFHRNSYAPDWSRFRAKETKWNERRTAASRKFERTNVSPLQGQNCPLGGDADVTQTCSSNPLNETSPAPRADRETQTPNVGMARKGLSREESREVSPTVANERFHVKSTSSRVAAFDAAERRWMTALTMLYASTPELFAVLIDAIDEPLSNAATALEMHKHGTGLRFILDALRAQLPQPPPTSWVRNTVAVASSCEQSTGESQT